MPSIALFVGRSGFVFSYSLFEIPNRSALDFVLVLAEISKFPLLCWKFLLLCWHYALSFPAPIMLKNMLYSIIDSSLRAENSHKINTGCMQYKTFLFCCHSCVCAYFIYTCTTMSYNMLAM